MIIEYNTTPPQLKRNLHLCALFSYLPGMRWLLFILLSLIWGSSFILMKEGLKALSAPEVAALRMLSAGIILLPFAVQRLQQLPRRQLGLIVLSGILGSFLPALLFCVAETRINSALAGMLNALTPLFVIFIGMLLFKLRTPRIKIAGVLIGFSGMLLLVAGRPIWSGNNETVFALLVVLATCCYGLNVNLVNRYLKHLPSLQIAAVSFGALIPAALLVLAMQGFWTKIKLPGVAWPIGAAVLLGVAGTAVATILFYQLLKRAGPLFSSMVTYGIPFVALGWGLLAGETITALQLTGLLIILSGVYLANRTPVKKTAEHEA